MSKNFWLEYKHRARLQADIADAIYQVSDVLNYNEMVEELTGILEYLGSCQHEIERQEKERDREDE